MVRKREEEKEEEEEEKGEKKKVKDKTSRVFSPYPPPSAATDRCQFGKKVRLETVRMRV